MEWIALIAVAGVISHTVIKLAEIKNKNAEKQTQANNSQSTYNPPQNPPTNLP